MPGEIWTSGGHHAESENAWRMAHRENAKAGSSRRERVIFILLGLLFLKFCVLLVFISLLFALCRSCEQEWMEYEKHCYFISSFELTWQNAENMCLNRGGYLAIINSKEEQNFLEKNLGGRMIWFGLTDQETENTFKWVDGTTLTPTSFSYWNEGEPNNLFGIENCVLMWELGKWNDEICNETIYAVCEKQFY
ncbi:hepatic lectin-like isoform X2 [Aquarana catesbeiana]|uniref:hepatic lectin-like isoform X2 n=1 Tax=Aquarana catesbeiana TaxID=8400 RepID=UPI003CC923C5